MAPPLYTPISFYVNWWGENQGVWTPSVGGMHLDCAAICHNSYGLGYIEIVTQPRFAEAIDVIDTRWNVTATFRQWNSVDQRTLDPAFCVCRYLYLTAGGVHIKDECRRPGIWQDVPDLRPNPNGIRDPVHFLYDRGLWAMPPGYKPIGVDPQPWNQPPTFDTQTQYYKYITVDRNNLPMVFDEQTGTPITPSWLSQFASGETRNVCGINMTLADLASRLQYAGGFNGPWTWEAMIAAYKRANPGQCGTSGGDGNTGGGTGGNTGGNVNSGNTLDNVISWAKRNQTGLLVAGATFAAIKALSK